MTARVRALFSDWALWALLLVLAICVVYYWHGIGPGDAERYIDAALDWREAPTLGDNHWALRHFLVLPMAASFALFGANEFAATLPNILYAVALVALTYLFAKRVFGRTVAIVAAGLIATSGFFVARPIELDVYGVEIVFVAIACWLFILAKFEPARLRYLAAAGFFTGLAWTVREQNMFLGVAFGLIVLAERKGFFSAAIALAGGFAFVLLAEMATYAIAAGEPLYRYLTDLNHTTVSPGKLESVETAGWVKTIFRPAKDILLSPLVVPNIAFAAIGYAAFHRDLDKALSEKVRYALFVFLVVSAIGALISSYGFYLTMPRYYPILCYSLFLLMAVFATICLRKYDDRVGAVILAVIVLANVFAADFSRYNDYDEARTLVRIALEGDEPIKTDPMTAFRARYLLAFNGMDRTQAFERIAPTRAPAAGDLYFKGSAHSLERGWCVIETVKARRSNWTHWLIRSAHLDRLVGEHIAETVKAPHDVALVRVGASSEGGHCRLSNEDISRQP